MFLGLVASTDSQSKTREDGGMAFTFGLQSSVIPKNATEIRVLIMDSKAHRPLKGRKVQIGFWRMDGQRYDKWLTLTGKTGADGVVVFEIKQPVPPSIDIVDLTGCPCTFPEEFPTQEILQNGVVGRRPTSGMRKVNQWCNPNPNAAQPQQRPGEVVFFIHPLNAWQNFWFQLLK
jgi:hypothetical protein